MGCHRSVVFGSPAKSLRLQDDSSFWHYSKRCKLPEKVSKHLNSTFHLTLKKSSVGLFFCLHCIASKKTPTLVKHYPFESKKLETPLVCEKHRGCNLSASQPLVAPPFVPLADGSRSPCLALS